MKNLNTYYRNLKSVLLISMTLIVAALMIQSCQSETSEQENFDPSLELEVDPKTPAETFDWGTEIHKVADEMPLFEGCNIASTDYNEKRDCSDHALLTYLYENLKYPNEAIEAGVEGRVYLQFVITDEGTIGKRRLVRDIGAGCGDAALAVLDKMVVDNIRWTPGIKDGKRVNLLYTLPVTYKLES